LGCDLVGCFLAQSSPKSDSGWPLALLASSIPTMAFWFN
jgi:hypothetical protein